MRLSAIQKAEACEGEPTITSVAQEAIQRALEAAGVTFVEMNGEGPGVRLRTER